MRIFTGWKDDAARIRMYRKGITQSLLVAKYARERITRGEYWQRDTHDYAITCCREYRSEIARLGGSLLPGAS